MYTFKKIETEDIEFIDTLSLDEENIFHKQGSLNRLIDYQKSYNVFNSDLHTGKLPNEDYSNKIAIIKEKCLSFVSQEDFENIDEILKDYDKLINLLKKIIGGFISFNEFRKNKEGQREISFTYNWEWENEGVKGGFVGAGSLTIFELSQFLISES